MRADEKLTAFVELERAIHQVCGESIVIRLSPLFEIAVVSRRERPLRKNLLAGPRLYESFCAVTNALTQRSAVGLRLRENLRADEKLSA